MITIRRMAAQDVPAVAKLRRQWTEENAGASIDDPGYEERFERWVAASDRPTWVAVDGGDGGGIADCTPGGSGERSPALEIVVGMVNLAVFERMPRPGHGSSRWGYLANAYVLPDFRDAGVGKLLVDALLDYARAEGLVRVVLSPSERSVRFYERAGFGPADMLMARSLTDS
jgi:GNAT superfamily N-acetyltransferase